jgi:hypothetical protein
MSKTLEEIAQQLKDTNKKVQLIYAFNGTGKTRLSRELKNLIAPKADDADEPEPSRKKILYYNAFTEDLFYWDNDLEGDAEPKLKIQPNSFTDWVLNTQGVRGQIVDNFKAYSGSKIEPVFNTEGNTISFRTPEISQIIDLSGSPIVDLNNNPILSINHGETIKISKGEESNFIWSIFYTLLKQVITELNTPKDDDSGEERGTDQFDELEYVFIDDPVSSLDENHLIELAVDLAGLIKSSQSALKFVITTHNPLFYNVLYSELGVKSGYILSRFEDGTFDLIEKKGDSNKSFSYHLYLKQTLEEAVAVNQIERYHFTLLRNLYEKTASFLGYPRWSELLPDDKQAYLNRIIQFTSHSTLSNEAVAEPSPQEKQTVKFLLEHLAKKYGYWQQEGQNA